MAQLPIQPQPRPSGGFLGLAAVLAIVGGLIAGGIVAKDLMKCASAMGWPTAKGSAVTGYVQAWESNRRSVVYEAAVSCEFEVGGAKYVCSRVYPTAMKYSTREDAEGELAATTDPTVHYNPSDPNDSCLTTKPNTRTLVCLGIALAGLAFGVFGIALQKRRASPAVR